MKKFFLTLFFTSLLVAEIDSDFDGVEDSLDRCLETPFDKLVDEYGCPQDELYLGRVNLELLYTYLLEEKENSTSFYLDYNYNNFLLSFSSAYASDYTRQDSLLLGYRITLKNSALKLYAGAEDEELLLSGGYEYVWQDYMALFSLNYYNQESSYISYMAGVGRSYEAFDFYVYYMNSGSTEHFSDEYRSVESVLSYNFNKSFYIKSGVNYSLVNEKLYDIYVALGVSFE